MLMSKLRVFQLKVFQVTNTGIHVPFFLISKNYFNRVQWLPQILTSTHARNITFPQANYWLLCI